MDPATASLESRLAAQWAGGGWAARRGRKGEDASTPHEQFLGSVGTAAAGPAQGTQLDSTPRIHFFIRELLPTPLQCFPISSNWYGSTAIKDTYLNVKVLPLTSQLDKLLLNYAVLKSVSSSMKEEASDPVKSIFSRD